MTFTKEQRIKGLKKQLRNLGYDVQKVGGSVADKSPDMDAEVSPEDRGFKTAEAWQRKEEAF